MSWKAHITNVKNKISPFVGILCKLRYYVPLKYLRLIYHSFIYSNLQYLASVWSTACDNNLNPLRVLQNKAIKHIYNLPYLEPTNNLYKPKQLMDIDLIYKYKVCCYIFSVTHKQKHSNINLITNNNIYNHNTRQTNHLSLANIKSNYGKKSVYFQGIKVYNNLPEDLKNIQFLSKFKDRLKKHLLNV